MSVFPSSKYNRLSEVLVSGGSDTGPKSEGVVPVTDATTFPLALTNPSVYGPSFAGGAPPTASGFTTTGGVGAGEAMAVAGAIEGVGVAAAAHPARSIDP